MSLTKAWGAIRASLEHNSFHDIKSLVGKAGLDLTTLASYELKYQGGASKGQLMTAIDGIFGKMHEQDRRHFATILTEELLKKDLAFQEHLEADLSRHG